MFKFVARLWRGEIALKIAFWDVAVIGGLLVNVTTTFGSLALAMNDERALALLVGYAIPIPYNIFALVTVWRSADREEGDMRRVFRLRTFTVLWLALLSIL